MDTVCVAGRPARHSVHLTLSEHTALNKVRSIVHEVFHSVTCSSALQLGRALAEKQLLVTVRTSLPHGFHSLKHQFLLVQTQLGGAGIVVDVEFRDSFVYMGLPGGTYAACVSALPQLLVGTMASVTALVKLMSDALEREAVAKGHDLPPWRSRRALLSNWFPERFTDDVYAPPSTSLHPVLLHTCHSQSASLTQLYGITSRACTPVAAGPGAAPVAGAAGQQDQVPVGGRGGNTQLKAAQAHGSKRKAEAAAAGGSPAKTHGRSSGPPPLQPPADTQRSREVMHRAESSTQPMRCAVAEPGGIFGLSAPSSLTSRPAAVMAAVRARCVSSNSSTIISSSSNTRDHGCSHSSGCREGSKGTLRQISSSSSNEGSSSGGGDSGVTRSSGANDPSEACSKPSVLAPIAPPVRGAISTAAVQVGCHVSGLTRKLLEAASAVARSSRSRSRPAQMGALQGRTSSEAVAKELLKAVDGATAAPGPISDCKAIDAIDSAAV